MWLVIKVGRSLGGTTETKIKILIKTRNTDQRSLTHLPYPLNKKTSTWKAQKGFIQQK